MGEDAWRMYCVHWNTRKARLARKSRADSRPATGRSWKPVRSARAAAGGQGPAGGWPAHPRVPGLPRPAAPSGRTLQEAGHVLQLRDAVLRVAAEALQQRERLQVLAAGVRGVQAPQRAVYLLPAAGVRSGPAGGPHSHPAAPAGPPPAVWGPRGAGLGRNLSLAAGRWGRGEPLLH